MMPLRISPNMIPVLLLIVNVGCFAVTFLFLIRFLCGPFSPKILEQVTRHPIAHGVWAFFAVVCTFVLYIAWHPSTWPPTWWERRTQRHEVFKRVAAAGGWEAVRRGCEALVTAKPDGFDWFPPRTGVWVYPYPQNGFHYVTNLDYGPLPPIVAALQPKEIRFVPIRTDEFKNLPPVVQLKIFGMHSTGGHSTPSYALEVPCGSGAMKYDPAASPFATYGGSHFRFKKIAQGIYEIY